ncbi:hypothetical protein [Streptomyces europaeiscabiei]|nr:hypothetical protein OHB30_07760 [Streptomyces europaeiscabiei]
MPSPPARRDLLRHRFGARNERARRTDILQRAENEFTRVTRPTVLHDR